MSELDAEEIRRLMAEGLDHYALGQADAAVACWRRVLEITPDHEEARDYLRAAEVDVEPLASETPRADEVGTLELTTPADAPPPAAPVEATRPDLAPSEGGDPRIDDADGRDPILAEAVALVRRGGLQEAIDLFETVGADDPDALELHAYCELARSRLVRVYRDRVGSVDRVPRLRISHDEILKFNLPAQAGFLLSLVDGATPTRSLLDLAGMDPFEGLRALSSLLDAGILEVAA
ncbi:MAG: hypothetical protein OEP95_10165 [Myxococcales bacterium]|nr:hypothetical protein [Myxococcales bacterium]